MTFSKGIRLLSAIIFLTTPMWAATIYGGYEDTVHGDYDYNDIVFQITGVTMNQTGGVFISKSASTLNDSGTPFWNHTSFDADSAHGNIGYCIFGDPADSGTCAGYPAGFAPNDQYLATSSGGSVNNVTFTPQGAAGSVLLTVSADTNELGYYDVNHPSIITWLNTNGATSTSVVINTNGDAFGLVGNNNNGSGGTTFYSQTALGNGGDTVSHFAFFADPVANPEPSTIALLGGGFLGLGFWSRKKRG